MSAILKKSNVNRSPLDQIGAILSLELAEIDSKKLFFIDFLEGIILCFSNYFYCELF